MITLVVHGGAWDIPAQMWVEHRAGVAKALEMGWRILSAGGSSLDAVEAAVVSLEDDPVFDAGRGSVLTQEGTIEMDASIMNGATLKAGAVAALECFANPIQIARQVMEKTPHLLLVGAGAARFARKMGFVEVPLSQLLIDRERQRLEQTKKTMPFQTGAERRGTVGAVALDRYGNLAAATSTGGTPGKLCGRVGDSPLIGCGTYAENGVGAVSATGWGEAIITVNLAHTIILRLEQRVPVAQAASEGIERLASKAMGQGGVIVLDGQGRIGVHFNTPRMARGYRTETMSEAVVEV